MNIRDQLVIDFLTILILVMSAGRDVLSIGVMLLARYDELKERIEVF